MGFGSFISGNLGSIGTAIGGIVGGIAGNPAAGAAIGSGVGRIGESMFDKTDGKDDPNKPQIYNYDIDRFRLLPAGEGRYAINTDPQQQFRSRQIDLAEQLLARSRGEAPSLADQQAAIARQSLFSQGLSGIASQRGINAGTSQRSFLNALAQGNQNIGAQAAVARLQEDQQNNQTLTNLLSGGRTQDIGLATNQAQGDLAARLAQLDATKQFDLAKGEDVMSRNRIRAGLADLNARQSAAKQAGNAAGIAGILGSVFGGSGSSGGGSGGSSILTGSGISGGFA